MDTKAGLLKDGRAVGYETGKTDGVHFQQVLSVRKNILKGKSAESIAEFMDFDIGFVRRLAEYIAEKPDVTDEELMEKHVLL